MEKPFESVSQENKTLLEHILNGLKSGIPFEYHTYSQINGILALFITGFKVHICNNNISNKFKIMRDIKTNGILIKIKFANKH